jgi:hypothetical protein
MNFEMIPNKSSSQCAVKQNPTRLMRKWQVTDQSDHSRERRAILCGWITTPRLTGSISDSQLAGLESIQLSPSPSQKRATNVNFYWKQRIAPWKKFWVLKSNCTPQMARPAMFWPGLTGNKNNLPTSIFVISPTCQILLRFYLIRKRGKFRYKFLPCFYLNFSARNTLTYGYNISITSTREYMS